MSCLIKEEKSMEEESGASASALTIDSSNIGFQVLSFFLFPFAPSCYQLLVFTFNHSLSLSNIVFCSSWRSMDGKKGQDLGSLSRFVFLHSYHLFSSLDGAKEQSKTYLPMLKLNLLSFLLLHAILLVSILPVSCHYCCFMSFLLCIM